jgi:hypothetical protein
LLEEFPTYNIKERGEIEIKVREINDEKKILQSSESESLYLNQLLLGLLKCN